MAVRIGCSGWSYRHWRGVLYPRTGSTSRWLELYASEFDTVEVNATFYRLPTEQAVARWVETVPASFSFAVKVSRYLTHVRRLRGVEQGLTLLGERIAPMRVAGALGPLLWQLPARFMRDDERLASALALLREGRHAFEFRHPSWFHDDVYALLQEHGAALVVADRAPEPTSPWIDTAGWWYVRLHHGRGRNGAYTGAELRRWSELVARARGDVYVYFNNDWEGFAVRNARTLAELLADDLADADESDLAAVSS